MQVEQNLWRQSRQDQQNQKAHESVCAHRSNHYNLAKSSATSVLHESDGFDASMSPHRYSHLSYFQEMWRFAVGLAAVRIDQFHNQLAKCHLSFASLVWRIGY